MKSSCKLLLTTIVGLICCNDIYSFENLIEDPSLFKACSVYKPGADKCFTNSVNAIWEKVKGNENELELLDPLHVPELKFEMDNDDGNTLKANFSDVTISGLSTLLIKEVHLCKYEFAFQVRASLPLLRFEAAYVAQGNITGRPVNKSGHVVLQLDNSDMILIIFTHLHDKGPFTFFGDPKSKLSLKPASVKTNIRNLFTQAVHKNPEGKIPLYPLDMSLFHKVVRPFLTKSMEVLFNAELQKLFSVVPANAFVSDMPTAADFNAKLNLNPQ